MKKEDLKKIVDRPEMIPGIYNYCDRWCERCNFTNRCATYAMEQEQFADVEKDLENKVFWQKLSEVFEITMEMILEDAEDLGIDLDDIDTEEIDAVYERAEELTESHRCSKLSIAYSDAAKKWFDEAENLLTQRTEAFADKERIGIEGQEAEELEDAIEVINWYKYQIQVKINRGLHGIFDEVPEDATPAASLLRPMEDFPKDSDGSIKVALIGIDRSIAAWGKLYAILPEKEDEILDVLILLAKLRQFTEKEFPNARDFKRAGFDD